jgi:hypothetical protein
MTLEPHNIPTRGLLVALVLVLATGCGGTGGRIEPSTLAAARDRWRAAQVRAYDLEWISRVGRSEPVQFLVYARDGTVQEARVVGRDGIERRLAPEELARYGVEGLFQRVEGMRGDPTAWVEYDERLGYPSRLRAREGRVRLDVVRLDDTPTLERVPPLPPRSVPAGSAVAYDRSERGAKPDAEPASSAAAIGPRGGARP